MKRIQFCCGGNRLPGFDNFDRDCDLTKRLPFADESYDFAFCEHGAEHFSQPDGFRFFEECHRILKPGGVLRLCVPHLERIQDVAHCRDLIVGHGHLVLYNLPLIVTVLQIAGFESVAETGRKDCDSHWKVIGLEKDDRETLRVEATKAK